MYSRVRRCFREESQKARGVWRFLIDNLPGERIVKDKRQKAKALPRISH
jgi:hypothetical protein